MKASEKRFNGLSASAKKDVARIRRSSIAKPKMKDAPVIFTEAGTIYFCKKESKAKCYACGKHFEIGDAYRVSTDSKHFKHVECKP